MLHATRLSILLIVIGTRISAFAYTADNLPRGRVRDRRVDSFALPFLLLIISALSLARKLNGILRCLIPEPRFNSSCPHAKICGAVTAPAADRK